MPILQKIIEEDWKENGTCNYLIAKEPFDKVLPAALGLTKGSRYTDSISKGYHVYRSIHHLGQINQLY